jgi:hypothetical protein
MSEVEYPLVNKRAKKTFDEAWKLVGDLSSFGRSTKDAAALHSKFVKIHTKVIADALTEAYCAGYALGELRAEGAGPITLRQIMARLGELESMIEALIRESGSGA